MPSNLFDDAVATAWLTYPSSSNYPQGQLPDHELETALTAQLAHAASAAKQAGKPMTIASCIDALDDDIVDDPRTMQVVARAVHKFDPVMVLVCKREGFGAQVARDCGIRVVPRDGVADGQRQ